MFATIAFAALLTAQPADIQQFAKTLESARAANNLDAIVSIFGVVANAKYLRDFARARKGIQNTELVVIPAPPGWEQTGKYWAIFHAPNNLQSDHDVVLGIDSRDAKWQLGPEVRERTPQGIRIAHADATVALIPATGDARIVSNLRFTKSDGQPKATVMRVNNFYNVQKARAQVSLPVQIATGCLSQPPKLGTILQAGGLIILWQPKPASSLTIETVGKPGELTEDRVNPTTVYLTGWWVPSVGRLPHTSSVTVTAPANWVLESEGDRVSSSVANGQQTTKYRCKIPLSYPKVIGGAYKLMGKTSAKGVSMSVFHAGEGDPKRAQLELTLLEESTKFFVDTFGSFPFDHYNLYDSDTFYGIESYSYTILHKRITNWAISHEMGHTYFGGLVPCSHTSDSWNEGMTQYVDSVWFKKNRDRTLNNGFASTRFPVPLTDVDSPWADGSISYMRGAYVLSLLEQEISRDKMVVAMKAMIKDRVGKDTTWHSLRPYFEKASGQDLSWFWRQWFESATFPKITISNAMASPDQSAFAARADVSMAAPVPNSRLRFAVRWTSPGHEFVSKHGLTVRGTLQTVAVQAKLAFRPERAEILAYPYTLATTGPAADVGFTLAMPSPWISAIVRPTMISH